MVQSFSTDNKYSFEIDEKPFFLQSIQFGDIDQIAKFQSSDNVIQSFMDYMKTKMDARTLAAVNKLSIPDVMTLLNDWTGGMAGKSSSSVESPQSTDPSSQQTSDNDSGSPSGE